jgi:hypothetical protein
MTIIICARCSQQRPHYAFRLCRPCYRHQLRAEGRYGGPTGTCLDCGLPCHGSQDGARCQGCHRAHLATTAALAPSAPCRHCGQARAIQRRGLCHACYYTPGVRDLYPSTSKYGQRDLDRRDRPPPATPTSARPGSEAKVRVLEERAARGEALFHPLDSREAPDLAGWLLGVA